MQKKIQSTQDLLEQEETAPALTPEGREAQLINLAYDLTEKRIRNGTASNAEILHFLNLGSIRTKLEIQKLKVESQLAKAKIDNLQSQTRSEELLQRAIDSMTLYSGVNTETDEND